MYGVLRETALSVREHSKMSMKNRFAYILILSILLPTVSVFAQKKNKAMRMVDRMAFGQAIPYLKKCARKGDMECEAMIAECYRRTFDYENATKWFEKAVNHPNTEATTYLHYGHLLMKEKRYEEAHEMFVQYAHHVPHDGRGKAFMDNLKDLERHLEDSLFVVIEDLPFNTPNEDFGAAPYGEGIVFASSRDDGSAVAAEFKWLGTPFLDLYYIPRENGKWGAPERIKGEMNSKYHESNFTFDEASGDVWFTRNNYHNKSLGTNENKLVLLKIYSGQMQDGKCVDVREFEYNDDQHSVTHPYIGPNGEWIYFVSDKEGGYGGKDIYRCPRTETGWGAPENLGSIVNTPGDEVFPFVHRDGVLYFASDGHPGLGHLDIFKFKLDDPDAFVHNLGYPINTGYDDFGYYIDTTNREGFLSSNRPGGKGLDDVYFFRIAMTEARLTVLDSIAQLPLEDVPVAVKNIDGEVDTLITSANGQVSFTLPMGQRWSATIISPEFEPRTVDVVDLERGAVNDTIQMYNPPPAMVALVVDSATMQPIPGAIVRLKDKMINDVIERRADRNGRFAVKMRRMTNYELYVKAPKYLAFVSEIQTTKFAYDGDTIIPLSLEPIIIDAPVVLKNIHYRFDDDMLRRSDYKELDKVATLMWRNPEIRVELSSHTDCRGDDDYNRDLSHRRARSAVHYLIQKGIPRSRIVARGYGEDRLLNRCDDGVHCSEAQHATNRRTEFTIIGFIENMDLENSVLDTRKVKN